MSSDTFLKPASLKRRAVHKNEAKLLTPKSSPQILRKNFRQKPDTSGSESESELGLSSSSLTDPDSLEVSFDQAELKLRREFKRPSPNRLYPDLTVQKETTLVTTNRKVSRSEPQSTIQDVSSSAFTPKKWFKNILFPVLSLLFLLAIAGGTYYLCLPKLPTPPPPPNNKTEYPYKEMQKTLISDMLNLRKKFPAQVKESWLTWLAALNTTLQEKPEQPATLLLASSDSLMTNCLAKHLGAVTNGLFGDMPEPHVIDSAALAREYSDPYKVKERLAEDMNYALEQSHAVVLENVQELPPKAAMILHGYCDNFVAPYKQRVIILTLQLSPNDTQKIDRVLHDLWTPELGVDTSSSIVSRVTNHVVVLNKEKADGCASINPF